MTHDQTQPPPVLTVEGPLPARLNLDPDAVTRHDGWTPVRQRRFLEVLAETGVVADAARAAGMSAQGAYALRRRKAGAVFALGWAAALRLARDCLADEVLSRAMKGHVETIDKDGVVTERHRHDNRLAMAVLTRLDRQTETWTDDAKTVKAATEDFEGLMAAIAAGGDEAQAFAAACRPAPLRAQLSDEVMMAALRQRDRYRGVAPEDIDISDLDPAEMAGWSDDQWDRADKSGLLSTIPDDMWPGEDEDEDEIEGDDEDDEAEADDENDDDAAENAGETGAGERLQ